MTVENAREELNGAVPPGRRLRGCVGVPRKQLSYVAHLAKLLASPPEARNPQVAPGPEKFLSQPDEPGKSGSRGLDQALKLHADRFASPCRRPLARGARARLPVSAQV